MGILRAKALLHGYEKELQNVNASIEKCYKDIDNLNTRRLQMEGAVFSARTIIDELQKSIDEEEKAKTEAMLKEIDDKVAEAEIGEREIDFDGSQFEEPTEELPEQNN